MLARLKLELNSEKLNIFQNHSSIFQGILMQIINCEYAEYLHTQGLKPYSQSIQIENDKVFWNINTLNKEAFDNIIVPMNTNCLEEFYMEKKNVYIKVVNKEVHTTAKESLFDEFYCRDKVSNYIALTFLSPTSFKSNGEYCIFPELRLIYQSLMNKYSSVSNDLDMCDGETLEQLVASSKIVNYKLRSVLFPIEKVKVPSFKGEITIRINKADTMNRYIRLLIKFGEYSGIGIKTGMGMGAIRLK